MALNASALIGIGRVVHEQNQQRDEFQAQQAARNEQEKTHNFNAAVETLHDAANDPNATEVTKQIATKYYLDFVTRGRKGVKDSDFKNAWGELGQANLEVRKASLQKTLGLKDASMMASGASASVGSAPGTVDGTPTTGIPGGAGTVASTSMDAVHSMLNHIISQRPQGDPSSSPNKTSEEQNTDSINRMHAMMTGLSGDAGSGGSGGSAYTMEPSFDAQGRASFHPHPKAGQSKQDVMIQLQANGPFQVGSFEPGSGAFRLDSTGEVVHPVSFHGRGGDTMRVITETGVDGTTTQRLIPEYASVDTTFSGGKGVQTSYREKEDGTMQKIVTDPNRGGRIVSQQDVPGVRKFAAGLTLQSKELRVMYQRYQNDIASINDTGYRINGEIPVGALMINGRPVPRAVVNETKMPPALVKNKLYAQMGGEIVNQINSTADMLNNAFVSRFGPITGSVESYLTRHGINPDTEVIGQTADGRPVNARTAVKEMELLAHHLSSNISSGLYGTVAQDSAKDYMQTLGGVDQPFDQFTGAVNATGQLLKAADKATEAPLLPYYAGPDAQQPAGPGGKPVQQPKPRIASSPIPEVPNREDVQRKAKYSSLKKGDPVTVGGKTYYFTGAFNKVGKPQVSDQAVH